MSLSLMAMAFCGSDTFTSDVNIENVILFIVALLVLRIWKLNPILVMVGSGVIGLLAGVIL